MAVHGVEIRGAMKPGFEQILTDEALTFVANLHRQYNPTRAALLNAREARQAWWDAGNAIDFAPETSSVRAGTWTVAGSPPDLQDRRVEITGPVDRKMVINALNFGARNASWPTSRTRRRRCGRRWSRARSTSAMRSPGRSRSKTRASRTSLNDTYRHVARPPARLASARGAYGRRRRGRSPGRSSISGCSSGTTRGRSWPRGRGRISTCPSSNIISRRGCGTTSSSHAQSAMGLPVGTIKGDRADRDAARRVHGRRDPVRTPRPHRRAQLRAVGLYLQLHQDLPRRAATTSCPTARAVNMTVPFMRAYALHVIRTCHRRGAHAMGGMSAFIPVKGDEAANDKRVRRGSRRQGARGGLRPRRHVGRAPGAGSRWRWKCSTRHHAGAEPARPSSPRASVTALDADHPGGRAEVAGRD